MGLLKAYMFIQCTPACAPAFMTCLTELHTCGTACSGTASTHEEAVRICSVLSDAGIVLRFADLVYLRPMEIAEFVVQVCPPRWLAYPLIHQPFWQADPLFHFFMQVCLHEVMLLCVLPHSCIDSLQT